MQDGIPPSFSTRTLHGTSSGLSNTFIDLPGPQWLTKDTKRLLKTHQEPTPHPSLPSVLGVSYDKRARDEEKQEQVYTAERIGAPAHGQPEADEYLFHSLPFVRIRRPCGYSPRSPEGEDAHPMIMTPDHDYSSSTLRGMLYAAAADMMTVDQQSDLRIAVKWRGFAVVS